MIFKIILEIIKCCQTASGCEFCVFFNEFQSIHLDKRQEEIFQMRKIYFFLEHSSLLFLTLRDVSKYMLECQALPFTSAMCSLAFSIGAFPLQSQRLIFSSSLYSIIYFNNTNFSTLTFAVGRQHSYYLASGTPYISRPKPGNGIFQNSLLKRSQMQAKLSLLMRGSHTIFERQKSFAFLVTGNITLALANNNFAMFFTFSCHLPVLG